MTESEKLQSVSTLLPPDLRKWVRMAAAMSDTTQSSYIRKLIEKDRVEKDV